MSLEDLAKKAEEGFEKVVDAAKEKAEEAKDKLAELAGDAKDKAEDAKDKAAEAAEDAKDQAEDVKDKLEKCATRRGRTDRSGPFSIPSSNPAGVLFPDNLTPASSMRTRPGRRRA